jgi:HD-GYP domain-containing protein (c-di-GMP phosphodiesterase class II)
MIEVPIDYVAPGDVLGKYHTFRKYEMGMNSSVNLERGYRITERVIRKLKNEYHVKYVSIEDPSPELVDVSYVEPFDEGERQQGISTIIRTMVRMKTSRVLDLRVFGPVVEDILRNVFNILKNGKGSFKSLSNTFQRVQSHDVYTWEHSVNTAIYAAVIALSIPQAFPASTSATVRRTSRLESLIIGMLLHDIGKLRIPESVLNKPGALDEAERELVRRHPNDGLAYYREVNRELEKEGLPSIPASLMSACTVHHQAYDGTGYPALRSPDGEVRPLRAGEIPIVGRIAAVADIFDAVSSGRPFRAPFHPVDAIQILRAESGRKLDPELVEGFILHLYPFPVGSTVVLTTHELAVVTGYRGDNRFEPIVRPIMRKVRKDGKEAVIRLPWTQQQNIALTAEARVKILVNKDIYETTDRYHEQV